MSRSRRRRDRVGEIELWIQRTRARRLSVLEPQSETRFAFLVAIRVKSTHLRIFLLFTSFEYFHSVFAELGTYFVLIMILCEITTALGIALNASLVQVINIKLYHRFDIEYLMQVYQKSLIIKAHNNKLSSREQIFISTTFKHKKLWRYRNTYHKNEWQRKNPQRCFWKWKNWRLIHSHI